MNLAVILAGKWTKSITDEYPYFNIVGEVWMQNQAHMAYWQKDSKISAIQNYNSYLPSVMDFTLHDAFGSVFNEDESTWDKGLIKVYENFTNDFLYPNPNNIMTFLENHDTNRFNPDDSPEQVNKKRLDREKQAMNKLKDTVKDLQNGLDSDGKKPDGKKPPITFDLVNNRTAIRWRRSDST